MRTLPFPIYTLKPGESIPPDSLCYLVTGKGLYRRTKCPHYEAVVPVDGVDGLADIEASVVPKVAKVPERLFRETEAFFVAVFKEHQSEAVVLLLCNEAGTEWKPLVPDQKVSGAAVSYNIEKITVEAGWHLFGSVHSHARMGAFHSGTDDKDEAKFDGLHITVGHLDDPPGKRDYAARWSLAGVMVKVELADVVDLPRAQDVECDKAWLDRVLTPAAVSVYPTGLYSHEDDPREYARDYAAWAGTAGAAAGPGAVKAAASDKLAEPAGGRELTRAEFVDEAGFWVDGPNDYPNDIAGFAKHLEWVREWLEYMEYLTEKFLEEDAEADVLSPGVTDGVAEAAESTAGMG